MGSVRRNIKDYQRFEEELDAIIEQGLATEDGLRWDPVAAALFVMSGELRAALASLKRLELLALEALSNTPNHQVDAYTIINEARLGLGLPPFSELGVARNDNDPKN